MLGIAAPGRFLQVVGSNLGRDVLGAHGQAMDPLEYVGAVAEFPREQLLFPLSLK